jgi:hypothetical protein
MYAAWGRLAGEADGAPILEELDEVPRIFRERTMTHTIGY